MAGHPMGSDVPAAALPATRVLDIDVASNVPVERLEVYRDGERVDVLTGGPP